MLYTMYLPSPHKHWVIVKPKIEFKKRLKLYALLHIIVSFCIVWIKDVIELTLYIEYHLDVEMTNKITGKMLPTILTVHYIIAML